MNKKNSTLIFSTVVMVFSLLFNYLKLNSDTLPAVADMQMTSRSLASVNPTKSAESVKQDLDNLAKSELKKESVLGAGKIELENFLSSYSGGKSWTIEKQTSGLAYFMSGALIMGLKKASYSVFKKDLLVAMNLESVDLTDSKVKSAGPEQMVDESKQMFKGYVVEGAQLRIFTRKSDHSIFLISSTLKDLGEPNLEITFSKETAEARLKDEGFQSVTSEELPVIFSSNQNKSQLAWVFLVKAADSIQGHRKILVSTYDGAVLQDIYIGMN